MIEQSFFPTLGGFMSDSLSQKKFILLNHLLTSSKKKKGIIPGGYVNTKTDKKSCWYFIFDNDRAPLPLIEKETLIKYASDGNFHLISGDGELTPIDRLNQNICEIFTELSEITSQPFLDSKLSATKFGKIIGMEKHECRYVIDKEFAANFPMLRALSFTTNKPATEFCENNSGCYTLYRKDYNSVTAKKGFPNGVLIRAAISVRYPIPHKAFNSKKQKQGNCNVKVKLNLPSYLHENLSIYEYDGLIGNAADKWWSWMFQGRFGDSNTDFEDLMMMYTDKLEKMDNGVAKGIMMTQNQDDKNTPTVSSIVLIREPEYKFLIKKDSFGKTSYAMAPDEDEFMRKTPKIINLDDPEAWGANEKKAVSVLMSVMGHKQYI